MTEHYKRAAVVQFGYERSPDQDATSVPRHRVVVVGAGPVGLATAIDLAQRNVPVVLLDDADRIGEGSRGLCYSKRALEILDRLGAGAPVVDKGVSWKIGKVFFRDEQVYQFDLLPEAGHKMPAFVNLQQYYLEQYLVERVQQLDLIDLRWRNKVSGVEQLNDGARLSVDTPEGPYQLEADYVIAADGARSTVRALLGLEFVGQTFQDQFLIIDIKMKADMPTERRFWFEPPFHGGQSALLHKQPDDVWRLDFQIGPEADAEAEQAPERVKARVAGMMGARDYELVWGSVYKFQCRRLERFRHGRIFFAGDSAHQVSPFGARGANSGLEDAENIAWKLALVLNGDADDRLLDTYEIERIQAADMNIGHSTRSTDFISPKSAAEVGFRNAVLSLSRTAAFARRMVNSGRLSTPATYDTPLSTPDRDRFGGSANLGAPLPDAPMRKNGKDIWLLNALDQRFNLLYVKNGTAPRVPDGVALQVIGEELQDADGWFAKRFDATPGACYLVRPDQHLTARFRHGDEDGIAAALQRARGAEGEAR